MSFRAVLFDMDGVIIDCEPIHLAAFQAVLKHHGHTLTDGQYKRYFAGKTDQAGFQDYFDSVGEGINVPAIMGEKAKAYLALASDRLIPYPGVIELIQDLAGRGIPLAIVTSSLRAEAELTLKFFGIRKLFSVVIAAEDFTHSKPDPESFLKGAVALHITPADCVAIEDTPSGVKSALAAGMRVIGVTNTHTAKELQEATLILGKLQPGCLDMLNWHYAPLGNAICS